MISPYYTDEHVTLYCADARDVIDEIRADALVTDPPYGIGLKAKIQRNAGRSGAHKVGVASKLYADTRDDAEQIVDEIIPRAIGRCSRALIFPGTNMMFRYPEPDSIGAVLIPSGSGYSSWGFTVWQPILYYGACPYLADGLGNRPNGFVAQGAGAKVDHPCPKPLYWMRWAVARVSRPAETILDPLAGSGTTLLAAKILGRRAIGVEIVEHYCEIAARRLAQGVLDLETDDEPDPQLALAL